MEAGRLRLPDASATRSIPARRQGGRGARPLSAPGGRTTAGNSFAALRLSPRRAAAPFSSFSFFSYPLRRAGRGSPARPGEADPCPLPPGMMASRPAAGPRFPGRCGCRRGLRGRGVAGSRSSACGRRPAPLSLPAPLCPGRGRAAPRDGASARLCFYGEKRFASAGPQFCLRRDLIFFSFSPQFPSLSFFLLFLFFNDKSLLRGQGKFT